MPTSLDELRAACASPLPHPGQAEMEALGQDTLAWIIRYFTALPDLPVGQSASRADLEALLRQPVPEEGRPFADVLAGFSDKVVPNSFRPNHPRFLAFIPAAPTFYAMLGDFLCAGTNFFAGVWLEASAPA